MAPVAQAGPVEQRVTGGAPAGGKAVPALFTPVVLRGVRARNRVVVSPMCQYRSVEGMPGDWQLVEFGKYAVGGAGIVFG